MSANYKNTKGELIAIYRLEFYKKQKKWKLCHDEKKKSITKDKDQCVNILNETYNIESKEPRQEPPAPLNDAFLVEESDKKTPHSNDQPKLPSPQPWPNEDLNLPELEAHKHSGLEADDKWSTLVETHHQRSYIEPIQHYDTEWWPAPAGGLHVAPPDPPPDDWTPVPYDLDPYPDYRWQSTGKVHPWPVPEPYNPEEPCTCWDSRPHATQEHGSLTGGPECAEVLDGRQAVHGVLRTAEAWLRDEDVPHLDPEPCWADVSVDSAWSFIRGAHSAPHSSELDLRPFTPCSCAVEAGQLGCLTAAQLTASVAQHARVLRTLLRELHARTRHQQHAPYKPPTNISQEQPTRDTGPSPSQSPFPLMDPFVAGSFMHAEVPGGRGRGRRIIGIGMGRPYRL